MEDEKKLDRTEEEETASLPMSITKKIWNIFTAPTVAYNAVSRQPNWLIPFLIFLGVFIIFSIATGPIQVQQQMKMIEENERWSAEQKAEIMERAREQAEKPIMTIIRGLIIPVILVCFTVFGASAALYFGGTVLLGGSASFKQVLAVYCHSTVVCIIGLAGTIVRLPLVLLKKSLLVQTSLAAFLPEADPQNLLFQILARFDIFEIWQIAIVSIGMGIIYKFNLKKSAGLVAGLWIIWSIIAVALNSLTGGMFT